jgi:hypothetical protein
MDKRKNLFVRKKKEIERKKEFAIESQHDREQQKYQEEIEALHWMDNIQHCTDALEFRSLVELPVGTAQLQTVAGELASRGEFSQDRTEGIEDAVADMIQLEAVDTQLVKEAQAEQQVLRVLLRMRRDLFLKEEMKQLAVQRKEGEEG